jgi:hypothetical protein
MNEIRSCHLQLLVLPFCLRFLVEPPTPISAPLSRDVNITGRKCVNDRRWIANRLHRSSSAFVPSACSYLEHYNMTEGQCQLNDIQAQAKFSDDSVLIRLNNCSSYFDKVNNAYVAFKMVLYLIFNILYVVDSLLSKKFWGLKLAAAYWSS